MALILHPHTMDLKIPEEYSKGFTVTHEVVTNQNGVLLIRSHYGNGLVVEYSASPSRCAYSLNRDVDIDWGGLPIVLPDK